MMTHIDKQAVLDRINFADFYAGELPALKPNGKDENLTLCPFHDDHNPSLSVNFKTGLFHCHTCKESGDIFTFYEKRHGTDFKGALEGIASQIGVTAESRPERTRGRIVKAYDYTDETGQVLYQTVRKDPKGFYQRRPDGNGGFINSIKNKDGSYAVRLVPYNLPVIKNADRKGVVICEGEKDADIVSKTFGHIATCNAMGAGKWHKDYNEYFRGKCIAIVPDNDPAGKAHALDVAKNLHGIAEWIKIIELPGMKAKGDMSDWIAKGGTRDQFNELINNAPEYSPEDYPIETTSVEVPEWPEVIPLEDNTTLPTFPAELLPDIGARMVQEVAEVNQVDPSLPASIYFGVLSTCLAGKTKINLHSHTEPLNNYYVSVLPSGERKSSSQAKMTNPVYEYQQQETERMTPEVRESKHAHELREAKQIRLRKQTVNCNDETERSMLEAQSLSLLEEIENNPPLKAPLYIVDDATPEKLGELMATHGERMSILSSEAGVFGIMGGRYSEHGNLDIYLKGHSNDPWSCYRIGREPQAMSKPTLTLSLTVQPFVMQEIGANKDFRGKGLLARFLYTICKPQSGQRMRQTKNISDALIREYQEHVFSLMSLPFSDKDLFMSSEAQEIWDTFSNDVEAELNPGGSLEPLKDWGNKLAGATARIAGLLHMAKHGQDGFSKEIETATVKAACVFGVFYKEHALSAFGLMALDSRIEDAKKILEYLNTHNVKTFKGREVVAGKWRFKTIADLDPGLRILIERGYIREIEPEKHTGRGRPEAMSYEVNPKAGGN